MRLPKAAIKLSGLIGVQSKLPPIIHQILFSNTRVWGRILRPESVKEYPIESVVVILNHHMTPFLAADKHTVIRDVKKCQDFCASLGRRSGIAGAREDTFE